MDIRKLVRDGVPISRIAELLGRDWRTVAKASKAEHRPSYRRGQRSSKLDPYRGFIEAKIKEAPYTGRRILEMIEAQGYRGGHTIINDYIAKLRQAQQQKAILRFETMPGEQMQVDWAEFGRVASGDGSEKKLYLFCAILGYSRMRYIEFSFSQQLAALLGCLIHSFEYFGGVVREVLFDNMKTVVLGRDLVKGTIEYNERFKDFCGYYGFRARLAWPYRAQTKGKVERSIGYVRQDFWPGVNFEGLVDLNGQGLGWCEKVNGRAHSETGEIPRQRLGREDLSPVINSPHYDIREHFVRRASRECWVSFEGNDYSVPWRSAGKQCTVLAGKEQVEIFHNSQRIAEHRRVAASQGQKLADPGHFSGLRETITQSARQTALERRVRSEAPAIDMTVEPVEIRALSTYEELVVEHNTPAEVLS